MKTVEENNIKLIDGIKLIKYRHPSCRESKKEVTKQGPTLGVCFTEVSLLKICLLRESTVIVYVSRGTRGGGTTI